MSGMRIALIGALAAVTMVPAAADAQSWGGQHGYRQIDDRDHGRSRGRGYDRAYGRDGGRSDRRWSGNDRGGGGRNRCDRGTGGTIIGAIAGGLLGNTVAGRGDRGVGTIVGAGVGALAGRSIDRDC